MCAGCDSSVSAIFSKIALTQSGRRWEPRGAGASPLSHPPGLGPLPRSHGNAEGLAHALKRNLGNQQTGRRPPLGLSNCNEARSQLCRSCRSETRTVNKISQSPRRPFSTPSGPREGVRVGAGMTGGSAGEKDRLVDSADLLATCGAAPGRCRWGPV